MKRIYKYTLVTILSMSLVMSCDNGFDEMNNNPVRLTSLDPVFQLNRALIQVAPGYGNLTYEVARDQDIAGDEGICGAIKDVHVSEQCLP